MPGPFRLVVSIPTTSSDGKYYGRYPNGNKPGGAQLAGTANAASSATGALTTGGASTTTTADLTTFSVSGTGTAILPFAHLFPAGAVPSGQTAIITDASNNVVPNASSCILATHADGSARHIALAGQLTAGGSYKLRLGTYGSGTNLTVSGLIAAFSEIGTVTFSNGVTGSMSITGLLSSATNRASGGLITIQQTPQCLELEVAQDFGTSATLRVTVHLKWFGGTLLWASIRFRNGYADKAGNGDLTYTVVTQLTNGTSLAQIDSRTITHWNRTQWYVRGATAGVTTFDVNGSVYAQLNAAYLISAGFPSYDLSAAVAPTATFLSGLTQSTAPMGQGIIPTNMDDTGYSPHIGILMGPCGTYFASGCDRRAFNWALSAEDGAQAWGFFFGDSANNGWPATLQLRPTWTSQSSSSFPGTGVLTSSSTLTQADGYPGNPSHIPSAGFFAFALTGDRVYLELMHAYGSAIELWSNTGTGYRETYNSDTIHILNAGSTPHEQIRGWAWAYRTWGQAAYLTPDSHATKQHWLNAVNGNMANDYANYVSPGSLGNVLGVVQDYDGDYTNYGCFEHYFLVQALGHLVVDLGLSGPSSQGLAFAQYAGKFVAGLMGCTGDYYWPFGPQYRTKVSSTTAYSGLYTSWAAYNAASVPAGALSAGDLGTSALASWMQTNVANFSGARNEMQNIQADATSYFANMVPAVAYLRSLNVTGAWLAWQRMKLSGVWPDANHTPVNANFQTAASFSITPRAQALPAYLNSLAGGQWSSAPGSSPLLTWGQISGTLLSSVDPSPLPPGTTGPSAKVSAWASAVMQAQGSHLRLVANGGHTDYGGNEVDLLDLSLNTPTWVQELAPTPNGSITASSSTGYYADGRPCSRHAYYNDLWWEGAAQAVLHGCAYVYGNPDPIYQTVDTYDPSVPGFSAAGTHVNMSMPGGSDYSVPKAISLASGLIYYCSTVGNFYKYNLAENSNTQLGANYVLPALEAERSGALDPKRGALLMAPGVGSQTGTWTSVSIDSYVVTDQSSAVNLTPGGQGGLEYDPIGDRYLYLPPDCSALYSINPVTFARTTLISTGMPGAPPNGVYGKFRVVPELNAVVLINSYSGNVYLARLG